MRISSFESSTGRIGVHVDHHGRDHLVELLPSGPALIYSEATVAEMLTLGDAPHLAARREVMVAMRHLYIVLALVGCPHGSYRDTVTIL